MIAKACGINDPTALGAGRLRTIPSDEALVQTKP
jgi:hypothetical protein